MTLPAKTEVQESVRQAAAAGVLTEAEVIAAYRSGVPAAAGAGSARNVGVVDLLYYIGGTIVFLGIVVLVAQNWPAMSDTTRILATLGAGLVAYVSGLLMARQAMLRSLSQAFFLISAVVLPIGLAVTFDAAGYDTGLASIQSIISVLLFAMYLASWWLWRTPIFTLFSVIFGTWFFFAVTNFMVGGRPTVADTLKFYEYRALIAGLTYVLLGYALAPGSYRWLTEWLYSVGVIGVLGSALALGGWTPDRNLFWESVYPGLVLGVIFLSLHLKSRAFLIFGAIFLMAYIFKITAEYFTDNLGWPLALVICGLLLMAIGYATFYLNRTYLKKDRLAV